MQQSVVLLGLAILARFETSGKRRSSHQNVCTRPLRFDWRHIASLSSIFIIRCFLARFPVVMLHTQICLAQEIDCWRTAESKRCALITAEIRTFFLLRFLQVYVLTVCRPFEVKCPAKLKNKEKPNKKRPLPEQHSQLEPTRRSTRARKMRRISLS